ncbi:MAG: MTH1187 family thiamine-binding protein [Pseudonocardiaceae bacterium]|nr:MTH1187 family thiamine-binding protein [Pseudonocardiaceae bacterium]
MIVAFSVSPAGGESGSVGVAVAEAVRVVRDSGLPYELNSMFTLVEGEWDEVMDVVKRAVHAAGAGSSRTSLVLKADIRPGHSGQLRAKVDRVEQQLSDSP